MFELLNLPGLKLSLSKAELKQFLSHKQYFTYSFYEVFVCFDLFLLRIIFMRKLSTNVRHIKYYMFLASFQSLVMTVYCISILDAYLLSAVDSKQQNNKK